MIKRSPSINAPGALGIYDGQVRAGTVIRQARRNFCFASISGHQRAHLRRPLYPQKRTSELTRGMSALCQKRTDAMKHGCNEL